MAEPTTKYNKLLIITVLFLVVTCVVPQRSQPAAQSSTQSYEKQMLDKLVNNNQLYDTLVRPTVKNTSEPIEVSIHVSVRSVDFLEMLKNEFTVNMIISQEWEDTRLMYQQFNPPKRLKYLTILDTKKIWKPDLYFQNEKSVAKTAERPEMSYARISPTGKVTLMLRITATLSCPVNIRLFPFDTQKCPFKIASAAFTRDDLILKWKDPQLPINVHQDFALMPGMAYHSVINAMSEIQEETGVYSCVSGGFVFNRLKGHYWKQLYIPCTCLVLLGWLSFFLDATGIPGVVRAILCGVTWTLAYMRISDFHHIMPKVAYSTAFDVWTGMCLAFVYISVIVMIISTYMANHGQARTIPPERIQALEARKRLGEISSQYAFQQRSACMSGSVVLDRILVFSYPILFIAFAIAYFTVYLRVARMDFAELKV